MSKSRKSSSTSDRDLRARASTSTVSPLSRKPRQSEAGASRGDDEALLAGLQQQIAQAPAINPTRVVQLHHRISNGEYRVDAKRLADKMLDFERSLDTPPPKSRP